MNNEYIADAIKKLTTELEKQNLEIAALKAEINLIKYNLPPLDCTARAYTL